MALHSSHYFVHVFLLLITEAESQSSLIICIKHCFFPALRNLSNQIQKPFLGCDHCFESY